jgi:anaerobic selenocysteine-containing dehydrogenase
VVTVRPAFQVLKDRLDAACTPDKASALCGVPAGTIRRLARRIAAARAASCIAGASLSKYYHGDLMMRAQILVFALCGQMGRKGAGYDTLPFLMVDGILSMPTAERLGRLEALKGMARFLPAFAKMKLQGYTDEIAFYQLGRRLFTFGGVGSVLYWYRHGGLKDTSGRSRDWDPNLKSTAHAYIEDAFQKGWQVRPPEKPPRVFIATAANTFRRVRGGDRLVTNLLPGLDLIVAIDLRISSTALHADYVLPAAASYEKCDVTDWYTPLAPFAHTSNAVVPPPGEAKPEWEIMALLAQRIEDRARQRGLTRYTGRDGKKHTLVGLYRRMTYGGRFSERDQEAVARTVIQESTHIEGSWQALQHRGFARFTGLGRHPANFGIATDFTPGETITPHTWRTQKKLPWPTLTRRIQFYIDQPLYLELGEELPVHKPPPSAGGDYPLILTGGHNRHSIHAASRTDRLMAQLEQGEPYLLISPADAAARKIAPGELVEAANDVGRFRARARVTPCVQPGQVIVYHAWEEFQFPGGVGQRSVTASPINPVELAGDYFHIRPAPAILQPGQNDRDTRVEVAPVRRRHPVAVTERL